MKEKNECDCNCNRKTKKIKIKVDENAFWILFWLIVAATVITLEVLNC